MTEDQTVSISSLRQELNLVSLADLELPERFEPVEVLGGGGMGIVVRARDLELGDSVAIKLLQEDFTGDADQLQRFKREAKTLASLNDPNILQIRSFGITASGRPYQVMELLRGQSLAQRLSEGPLSLSEFRTIFLQVISGLKHASDSGVVHRDVKPSNIFLVKGTDLEPIVKLVDFGIARVEKEQGDTTRNLTGTSVALGSPLYMSPEQCRGSAVDFRSDIYSLGCVMYECITRNTPFRGDSPLETMYLHNVAAPKDIVPGDGCPKELADLIMRCLEKSSEARPKSYDELTDLFTYALLDADSRKIGTPKVAVQKKNSVLVVVSAVLLVLGLATAFFVFQKKLGTAVEKEPSILEMEVRRLEGNVARLKAAIQAAKTDGAASGPRYVLLQDSLKLAEHLPKLKRVEDAKEVYLLSADCAKRLEMPWEQAQALTSLAELKFHTEPPDRWSESEALLIQSDKLLKEAYLQGTTDDKAVLMLRSMTRSLIDRGIIYAAQGRFDEARKMWRQMSPLCAKVDNYTMAIDAFKSIEAYRNSLELHMWMKPKTPEDKLIAAELMLYQMKYLLEHGASRTKVAQVRDWTSELLDDPAAKMLPDWEALDQDFALLNAKFAKVTEELKHR